MFLYHIDVLVPLWVSCTFIYLYSYKTSTVSKLSAVCITVVVGLSLNVFLNGKTALQLSLSLTDCSSHYLATNLVFDKTSSLILSFNFLSTDCSIKIDFHCWKQFHARLLGRYQHCTVFHSCIKALTIQFTSS